MFPVVATGALNPEPGLAVAAMTAGTLASSLPTSSIDPLDAAGPKNFGAEALAAQILGTVERCQRLGHRQPSITLTRPAAVVDGVAALLSSAGLAASVRPVPGGFAVLSVRF